MSYRLTLEFEAAEFLFSLGGAKRGTLVRWIAQLKNAPFSTGGAVVLDSTEREIQVSEFPGFQIQHWTDHAVKTVMVIKIELA